MRNKSKGFSLIELLIVVAIILIIAAIAIPNLLRARITANETSAVGSVRTINTGAVQYSSTYGNGFPPTLLSLGPGGGPPATCGNADLIDQVLAGGQKSGYNFVYTPGAAVAVPAPGCAAGAVSYDIGATPVTVGTTGQRSFCTDQSGVVRQDPSGVAIAAGGCVAPLAVIAQ